MMFTLLTVGASRRLITVFRLLILAAVIYGVLWVFVRSTGAPVIFRSRRGSLLSQTTLELFCKKSVLSCCSITFHTPLTEKARVMAFLCSRPSVKLRVAREFHETNLYLHTPVWRRVSYENNACDSAYLYDGSSSDPFDLLDQD